MATLPYYAFAVAAGAMLPFQFGINAVLSRYVESPLRATLISFAVGTAVLAWPPWPSSPGRGRPASGSAPGRGGSGSAGFLGAFYVLGSVVTAPKLGAATLVALILAGQALASLTVDHFGLVGFDENPVTPTRLIGVALSPPASCSSASSERHACPLRAEAKSCAHCSASRSRG